MPMAEPIGTASAILALAGLGLQAAKALHDTITDFKKSPKSIRELKDELEALNVVLKALEETIHKTDADFSALELPLRRCGSACREFQAMITRCTTHSTSTQRSFQDWVKLKYMGEDINGFKNMLASYKSTIAVALCDANLRTSAVTFKVLTEYKDMIENTSLDLEQRLVDIDSRLQSLLSSNTQDPRGGAHNQLQMEEEKQSVLQCLDICSQVSDHIKQLQFKISPNVSASTDESQFNKIVPTRHLPARISTAAALRDCMEKLDNTSSKLQTQLDNINQGSYLSAVDATESSATQTSSLKTLQEELDGIKTSLAICSRASEEAEQTRTNVFEDISKADDGHQVIVSTIGDLITARNVSAGARVTQLLGQMSDDSLQHFSSSHTSVAPKALPQAEKFKDTSFEGRYGFGRNLKP